MEKPHLSFSSIDNIKVAPLINQFSIAKTTDSIEVLNFLVQHKNILIVKEACKNIYADLSTIKSLEGNFYLNEARIKEFSQIIYDKLQLMPQNNLESNINSISESTQTAIRKITTNPPEPLTKTKFSNEDF